MEDVEVCYYALEWQQFCFSVLVY